MSTFTSFQPLADDDDDFPTSPRDRTTSAPVSGADRAPARSSHIRFDTADRGLGLAGPRHRADSAGRRRAIDDLLGLVEDELRDDGLGSGSGGSLYEDTSWGGHGHLDEDLDRFLGETTEPLAEDEHSHAPRRAVGASASGGGPSRVSTESSSAFSSRPLLNGDGSGGGSPNGIAVSVDIDGEPRPQGPGSFKKRQTRRGFSAFRYFKDLADRLSQTIRSSAVSHHGNRPHEPGDYDDDDDDEDDEFLGGAGTSSILGRGVHRPPQRRQSQTGLFRIPGLYYGPSRLVRPGPPVATNAPGDPLDWGGFSGRRVAYDNFTTIDWIHDLTMERMRLVALRSMTGWQGELMRIFDSSQAWILVFFVGVITGCVAGYIDIGSVWLSDIKEGYCSAGFYLNRKFCCWHRPENAYCSEWKTWPSAMGTKNYFGGWILACFMYTLFAVAFAASGSFLVKVFAPYAAGEGVPEIKTILGGFVIRKFLGGWTLLIKIVGLVLSVGSGLSLGKEGPLVHISCCLGNILPRVFKKYANNEAKKREILSASSAAGISVAFGAPIGGVLFSLEEVWFQVTYSRDWHAFEMPIFILLGVIGGLAGTLFIRMNIRVATFRKSSWLRHHPISEVAFVALLTGIVGYSHVFLRVSTVDLVANLFRECAEVDGDFYGLCKKSDAGVVVFLLLFAAGIKFVLTVLTFGILLPAGIFTPSMAIGACVGRALGIIMELLHESFPTHPIFSSCNSNLPCITPGTYAMVGAAAFLSGTTRMTVSLTVIMFELTGAVSYVLPIIVTVLTAKWVGDAGGKGLYYLLIRLEGYPFLDGGEEYKGDGVVKDVMTAKDTLEVIPGTGLTVRTLEELLQTTVFKGFPVVNSFADANVVGYAGRAELRYALAAFQKLLTTAKNTPIYFVDPPHNIDPSSYLDMRPWIEITPPTVPPIFPVGMCVELFKKMGSRYVLVTTEGRLEGIVTKKDLLRHSLNAKMSKAWRHLASTKGIRPHAKLALDPNLDLDLRTTLFSGQSFIWRETGQFEWSAVLTRRLISLKQTPTDIMFRSESFSGTDEEDLALLRDYFRLGVCLPTLKVDENFKKKSSNFPGLRLLRQDPVENLFSFICTSNNNIARITQMIDKFCAGFGERIPATPQSKPDKIFYAFPTLDSLLGDNVEETLRGMGFGYRAKYVSRSAKLIADEEDGGEKWLMALRDTDYATAKEALLRLPGVGAKVADCVLLMSMDKLDSIPVDTHVWQIARRDYGVGHYGMKTLTPKVYRAIGDKFRDVFGEYAGLAN
ncbi:hypothetical protein HK101_000169 [Irineochytrium annulatum]|nr:hypothetical protein HK101_000169 [Irineochytrium annulatum]